jgi:heat shock protein HtpX
VQNSQLLTQRDVGVRRDDATALRATLCALSRVAWRTPPRQPTPSFISGSFSLVQTFYEQQATNRRMSLLLVIVVGGSLFVVVTGVLALTGLLDIGRYVLPFAWGFAIGSYEAGDTIVLWASGARRPRAEEQRRLLNVVTEMSVAANIPRPSVYVIDDDAANILATGRDARHASVAVTTGLLKMLDREELQGVVAHEVAHIRTLDTRLGLAVVVLLSGIPLLRDATRAPRGTLSVERAAMSRGLGRRATLVVRVGLIMVAGVAVLLAIFAPVFAVAIRLAIGGEREFLADATAVELTRNPNGLERALSKLASDREVLRATNRAMRHLYFVDPLRSASGRTFRPDTHPAIEDRIERLRRLTSRDPIDHQQSASAKL